MTDEKKTTHEDIQAEVAARIKAEQEALEAEEKKEEDIAPFVRECFRANEMGDGTLFAHLHKGQLMFNNTSQKWYRWLGHYWELDKQERVFPYIENVVAKYNDEVVRLMEEEKKARTDDNKDLANKLKDIRETYETRIKRLRSQSGAEKCLTWSHRVENSLGIAGDELDRDPWLLACQNGVIELKTGRIRHGRPTDFLSKAIAHKWKGIDEPAPAWVEFLNVIFEGNQELISFVQRLFGYCLTGIVDPHIFIVLYGELGRNGKGTLVEMLQYIFGPLSRTIQTELLLDQKFTRSSAGPSPDIMSLHGARLAFAAETDEGRRFAAGKIKNLSGGDRIVGRHPNDKYEMNFEPTHKLCLMTNFLPHAPADDTAFWERLMFIPFNIHFTDTPTKPHHRKKLYGMAGQLKSEVAGILAWLVRGCIDWQRQGLNPPPIVLAAKSKYQFNEDLIANFLADCCEPVEQEHLNDENIRVSLANAWTAFNTWYGKTIGDEKKCPKNKKFGQLMEKRGFRKEAKGGTVWIYGLILKYNYAKLASDDV